MKENLFIILGILYATLISLCVVYIYAKSITTSGILFIIVVLLFPLFYEMWKRYGKQ